MQDSPIETPLAPVVQRPKSSGLAIESMVLGILSVTGLGLVVTGVVLSVTGLGLVPISDHISEIMFNWVELSGTGLGLVPWLPLIGFCLALLGGLAAIITGHIAYGRARKAPEQYGGARFAIEGFVMGYAIVTMLLLAIAIPSFIRARQTASIPGCISNLKQIDGAKEQWALENKKTKGEAVVDEEVNAYLKNSQRPVCPSGGTYTYGAVGVNPTCSLGAAPGHTL